MKKIKELKCTCSACPEQYEGIDFDGNEIYIRIRWGSSRFDINDEPVASQIFENDGYKGCFENNELIELIREAGYSIEQDELHGLLNA